MAGTPAASFLGGVEDGEVLANNFVGRVALKTLGTRIPTGYSPLAIQHVDGVVADRIDEQRVTLLICVGVRSKRPRQNTLVWLDINLNV